MELGMPGHAEANFETPIEAGRIERRDRLVRLALGAAPEDCPDGAAILAIRTCGTCWRYRPRRWRHSMTVPTTPTSQRVTSERNSWHGPSSLVPGKTFIHVPHQQTSHQHPSRPRRSRALLRLRRAGFGHGPMQPGPALSANGRGPRFQPLPHHRHSQRPFGLTG